MTTLNEMRKIQTLSSMLQLGNNTLANKYFLGFINQIASDILSNVEYFDTDPLDLAYIKLQDFRESRSVEVSLDGIGIEGFDIWMDVDYDFNFTVTDGTVEKDDIDINKITFFVYDAEFDLTDNTLLREQIINKI